jgi:hypothetical protein
VLVFILELQGLGPLPCCNSGLIWDNKFFKGCGKIPWIGNLHGGNRFLECIICSRISMSGWWIDQTIYKELNTFQAYDKCHIV